jgi:antitoxin StbD
MARRERSTSRVETARPRTVETVRGARQNLSTYLDEARELGADAPLHFFGSHRKPEGVVMSFETYLQLSDAAENAEIAVLAAERIASRGKKSIGLDEAMAQLGFDPHEHDLG